MFRQKINSVTLWIICFTMSAYAYALPPGFVYLRDIDASILQEIRYAGNHNFIGRPVHGYASPVCIVTKPAAHALKKIQTHLWPLSLSLKIYDCYRPTQAVLDFVLWSQDVSKQEMKQAFYPNVDKSNLFKWGYIAKKSGHSRGSTLDLTLVRLQGNSFDMGTGFDYLDKLSSVTNAGISILAKKNRDFLQRIMVAHGFVPYEKEWWHFTLKNEPFPHTYFNFVVK